MSENLIPSVPGRRNVRRSASVVQSLLVAGGLALLSFPVDAGGTRGGGGGSSHGGSGGGGSHSTGSRSSSGGGRSYTSAAPRASSSGGRSWSASSGSSSHSVRSYSGDRSYSPSGYRPGSGPRTYSSAGMRGGQGGSHPGGGSGGGNPGGGHPGGHPGGGHPGGGHSGGGYYGGHHGWYCPPTYYAGSSWLWGGPWDWWWGWGSGWGWGWGGSWGPYGGGVYVISDDGGVPGGDRYARVDTDVSPEAAEVYLDATLIGQADDFDGYPDYLYLAAGKYRLEFRHPFYETVVKELDVQPGQAISINDEMKLLPGKKKLQVVDPEHHGTPLGRVFGKPEAARSAGVTGRTGRFEVTGEPDSLRLDEVDEIDEDVLPPKQPAPPAEPEVWRAPDAKQGDVAPASQGRLRFDVEPDDAAIYVDDRYVGTAEELGGLRRGLRVKPGKHTVTVVRPGFASKTVEVESKAGAAVDVVVELEK